jgi:hypothetical protein
MPEISRTHMGGTMRLGLRPTVFQEDTEWSRIRKLYGGASVVWERHRHRYEVNPAYVERLHTSGMAFIGRDEKGERMQIMELPSVSSALPPTPHCIDSYALCRSSLLCWLAGTPRILHAPAQSVTPVSWFRGGGVRPRCSRTANGTTTAVVSAPASQGVDDRGTSAHPRITRTTTHCRP